MSPPSPDPHALPESTLAHLEAELQKIADPEKRRDLLLSLARLQEQGLNRPEEALFHYKEVLNTHPDLDEASDGVCRILYAQGRWVEVEQVLKKSLHNASDRERRARLEFQLGDLYRIHLKDFGAAIEAYKRVLDEDPLHRPTYPLLENLYIDQKNWTVLAQHYADWLEITQNKNEVLGLLNKSADVWIQHLQIPEQAQALYEDALGIDPKNPHALQALIEVYKEQERWLQVTRLLIRQTELEMFKGQDDQVRLLLELAEVYGSHLNQLDHAEMVLRKILILEPGETEARERLAKIHESKANWLDLIAVYRGDLGLIREPLAKLKLLFKIAQVTDAGLGKTAEGTDVLLEGLAVWKEVPVPTGLEQYGEGTFERDWVDKFTQKFHAEGRFQDLKLFYEDILLRPHPLLEKARALKGLLEMANREEWQSALDYAEELHELAKRLPDPHQNEFILYALRELSRIFLTQENWRDLIDVYNRQVNLTSDQDEKALLFFRIGEVANHKLHLTEMALQSYARALELNPSLTVAIRARRELLLKIKQFSEAITLLQMEISLTSSAKGRAQLFLLLGRLREKELKQPEAAVEAYELALQNDPDNDEAIRLLGVYYYQNERWDRAQPLFARMKDKLDVSNDSDPMRAAAFLVRSARIATETGDRESAIHDLKKAVELNSSFAPALAELGHVYFQQEDFAKAQGYYQEYLNQTDSEKSLESEKIFFHLGRIQERQNQDQQAIASYRAVFEINPQNLEALEALVNLESLQGNWALVEGLYQKMMPLLKNPADLTAVQFALADIWENRLKDSRQAIKIYLELLNKDPLNPMVLESLAELNGNLGELDAATEIYQRLYRTESDTKKKVRYLFALARIFRLGTGNLLAAQETLEQILLLDPGHLQALKELSEVHQSTKHFPKLAETFARIIVVVSKKDRLMAIPFYLKLGEIYKREIRQPLKAIEAYKEVLKIDPDNIGARNALVELFALHEDFHDEALKQHRLLLQDDPLRLGSYRVLAQIYLQKKEVDRGYCLFNLLHFFGESTHEENALLQKCEATIARLWRGELPPQLRQDVLDHPDEKNHFGDVLNLLRDEIRRLFYDERMVQALEEPLGPFGRQVQDLLDQAANVLLIRPPRLKVQKVPEYKMLPIGGEPSVFLVTPAFLSGSWSPEKKFQILRMLDSFVKGREIIWRLNRMQLERLFSVIISHFFPGLKLKSYPEEELKNDLKSFKRVLPRRVDDAVVRKVEQLAKNWGTLNISSWIHGIRQTGNRVGLLLTGDLESTLNVLLEEELVKSVVKSEGFNRLGQIAHSPDLKDLIKYATSEDYFRLRLRIGKAVPPGKVVP